MADVKFIKADGTATTLDTVVDNFKATIKFTDDNLTSSEYIQLDDFSNADGSLSSMIVITLFASLGGKLNNSNRIPVNIGLENFVDLMVTPKEAGVIEALRYENAIKFKNANSVKTKFKVISGSFPPGLNFGEEIGGTSLDISGSVYDSAEVFNTNWSINSNESFNFNQESLFKNKVEFLNIRPTTGFSVGNAVILNSGDVRTIEAIDTYTEDEITKTKIQVPYVIGTENDPSTLIYEKNQVFSDDRLLLKSKDPDFVSYVKIISSKTDIYSYTDTKLVINTTNVQDQIYKDYDFVVGMYDGDTDSLLTQQSFSIRVYQNYDAIRDDYLKVRQLSGRKRYFPYLDMITNYKLPLLKSDATSTFILMETNQLIFGEQKIETTNGLLTLIKENGTTSNITLQPA